LENIDIDIDIDKDNLKNIDIDIDIDMAILENIDIDIDIDKGILQNINIDIISYRLGFGISNTPTDWQLLQPILPFPIVPSSSQGDCQLAIGNWLQLTIGNCLFQWLQLAVKEVSSHEKLKGNLGGNRELRDLSGGVGVPGLVCEVHAHFLENMAWDFAEVHLIGLILCKLARTREHCLDSARGKSMVPGHHKLMPITADQLHIHGIRTLTASINLFSSVHGTVCCAHPRFLPNLL